ncbi:MAG: VWA domain-containing protein [Hyphomicrobiaceae bacterium]
MRKTCLPISALFRCLAALVGVAALLAPRLAAAADSATLVIVFDGSGSMWGRIDGQRDNKLGMARDGVSHGLARLSPATRVGLMSFGHRHGGDCQDTETIITPAPLDIERVMSPLERLNPRGRGPLTKALREAIGLLGPPTAPAHIVLVHDGADNCQEDPCSVLAPLKAAHPGARVDVVSMGLPPDEARTLACLPQSTGGKQYLVSAAADIDAAIVEALASTPAAAAAAPAQAGNVPNVPVPSAARRPGRSGRPGLQLWATLVKGGEPLAVPVSWRVRRAGEPAPVLWEGRTPSPLIVLPTGRYDVEAKIGLITRTAVAEAVEGSPRALAISLDAGLLTLAQSKSAKAMLDDAVITLSRIEAKGPGEPRILRRVDGEIALPSGNYLVSLTSGTLRIERPVGIVAGERVSIANALALGSLELEAAAIKGGPRLEGLVYTVFEDDPDVPQGRREVARSAAATPSFKLPAGTYYVVARRGITEARDRVSVRSGEVERHRMVLDSGRVDIAVKLVGGRIEAEGPVAHRLERTDVQPAETFKVSGPSASLDLSAGQYRLLSRIGLGNVRAVREFRLKPGEVERLVVEHAAAGARFRMLDRAGGRALPDISFEVRDDSGQAVWSGLGTEPRVLLMAGRYTVRAEGRGVALERPFNVAPGEERIIELVPR